MRPRSLVAPLIVILIGALFLANNLWPGLSIRHLAFMYWPFLLIAWGLLRLFEVVVWALTSRQTPHHGISGGEWTLIVLICLIGSLSRHIPPLRFGHYGSRAVEVFGQPYDYPISDQKQVGKKPHIVIENLRGNTRVVVVDTEEMKVDGRKTIRALLQSDAQQADKQSPLQFVVNGSQVFLSTSQERVTGDRIIRADLELSVPRGADIRAHSRTGDFDISGIMGNVVIDSDNTGVRLQDIGGDVRVNARRSDIVRALGVKGSVELHGGRCGDVNLENIAGPVTIEGVFTGDQKYLNLAKPLHVQSPGTELQVEAVPGQITTDLSDFAGTNLVGPIRLNAKNKDVRVEDFKQALSVSVERGDINVRPGRLPLAKIEAHTRYGDVAIALPQGAKFELTATTKRGEIQNEFGDALKVEAEGRGATLKGAVGSGPAVTLDTTRGSITVERGELKNVTASKEPKNSKGESLTIQTPGGTIKVQKE